ncbi:MAG: flavin reductase family protein [bacterium]|nr:flavin reductase family protein [bacterium]
MTKKVPQNTDPRRWETPLFLSQAFFLTTTDHAGNPHLEPVTRLFPLSDSPPLLGLVLSEGTLAHRHLAKTREFVVNPVPSELALAFWQSGEAAYTGLERIGRLGLTLELSRKVGPPRVAECPAHLECRVVERKPLPGATLYTAEILAVEVVRGVTWGTLRERFKVLAPLLWLREDGEYCCEPKSPRRAR